MHPLWKKIPSAFSYGILMRLDKVELKWRQRLKIAIQSLVILGASGAAWGMLSGTWDGIRSQPNLYLALSFLFLIRTAVFWKYDLFHSLWRYVGFQDLVNIVRASSISSIIFAVVGVFWESVRMPERFYILDLVLCITFVGGIRLIARNWRESRFPSLRHNQCKRVFIVGPLERVQTLIKEMLSDEFSRFYPLAVFDPTLEIQKDPVRVSDVPVYSLRQVSKVRRRFKVAHGVVLCWPGATRRQLDEAVEVLKVLHVPFKTVPHMDQILSGEVTISDIRDVEIEDLLERPPVQIHMDEVRAHLQGRVVMVTGGGGSIGSELCRQIASFEPKGLVIVERAETSLYHLREELIRDFPRVPLVASISSVNDYKGMVALMRKHQVKVVYHAAAYKHVPLMEIAPIEAAYNNILGTWNVVRAATECGVDSFVMISTDKAVNPTNIMGATKRVAEMIVRAHNKLASTRFMIVRFGNVLGSAGSVIPIFKQQIAKGGPVTVTHPNMERYFMTIQESVQLILQASCMGEGGEVFVLDMGRPVNILYLAEKLISLSGKKPYEDIEIVFTQIRPGEKLSEKLFEDSEAPMRTKHPRILMATCPSVNFEWMMEKIEEIRAFVSDQDSEGLRRALKELIPTYSDYWAQGKQGNDGLVGETATSILAAARGCIK